MNTCPCGIARVDCEYHRPEPEPVHDDEWCHAEALNEAILMGMVRLSSDCGDYVRTYQDGKLVDEEPAESYQMCPAMAYTDGYLNTLYPTDIAKAFTLLVKR